MGLGPNHTSLFAKLGRPEGLTFPDPFAMLCEQVDRQEARLQKAIEHAMKHKKPPKPIAPVTPYSKRKGEDREWEWIGESIESKNLLKGAAYSQTYIRKMGFKLPKLKTKG